MGKEEELKVGDRVYHKKYGKGTIIEIDFYSLGRGFPYVYLVELDNCNCHRYWLKKSDLTKLEQIVIKDIDGGERTYDFDLSGLTLTQGESITRGSDGSIQIDLNERTQLEYYPEPDKPQEIEVKIGDKTIYSNIERKEEKENMENRVYSILNIYEQNRLKEMNEEYEKKKQEITKGDSILKDVRAFEKTLRKKYSNDNISLCTDYLSKETSDIIAELYKEKNRKETELYKYREEVKAQIKLCDTYDQVIDILVSYGIIDKKTKKIN